MARSEAPPVASYRLDELGWLQFDRLCSLLLEMEAGGGDLRWRGRSDEARVVEVHGPLTLGDLRVGASVLVGAIWVQNGRPMGARLAEFVDRIRAWLADSAVVSESTVVVLTNIDAKQALVLVRAHGFVARRRLIVVGAAEISAMIDARPQVRAALPSVLGLRDLEPLIAPAVRARSSFDLAVAQELALVFWPTRAYEHARAVLGVHRFVVLTGPPEMGKTAIARMIGLSQMTDGWEVHECIDPDQVGRVFDGARAQVFVADDAFGSTEYRPESAERWALALGQLLGWLDERHWLVWTSRPAPLKAALRRLQRERGAERFPAPAEVLVDASNLDLEEKTMILFRHAKSRGLAAQAREFLRSRALAIVEHPHFTPERIRRFATDQLDSVSDLALDERSVSAMLERELASPTEAMRASFVALSAEHRDLLVALLDAPGGLIDERELAATMRRHHSGGLSRPPAALIDRLTDHFLRVTPFGIGWVHPSWRDLVIDQLREDEAARRAFLARCGIDGVLLGISVAGGVAGERIMPLMIADWDWDQLGDRLHQLLPELEDRELVRALITLLDSLVAIGDQPQRLEAHSLASWLLGSLRRAWDQQRKTLTADLLGAWYSLRQHVDPQMQPPQLSRSWAELHPASTLAERADWAGLALADDWLAFAQVLSDYDRDALEALGFFQRRDKQLLQRLILTLTVSTPADETLRQLAQSVLARIQQLIPHLDRDAQWAIKIIKTLQNREQERWWGPEDIPAPPSSKLERATALGFGRGDVARVLKDL